MTQKKDEIPYKELLDSAWDEFSKNNHEKAADYANQIIEKHPDAIGAYALNAHIHFDKNRFDEAIKGFEKCIELDIDLKNHGCFYYWIGRIYDYYDFKDNSIHDSEKAHSFYKKALDFKNYPPDLFLKLLQKKDTYYSKKELLERGISEFPEFIPFYIRIYSISNHLNNSSLIKILNEAYVKTKSYTIDFLIGKYYEENQNYSEAISHYLQSLEVVKDNDKTYFYFSLGTSYYKNNESPKALEYLQKITDENSRGFYLTSILLSAYIQFLDGDNNEAINSLTRIHIDEYFFQIDLNDVLIWLESEYPTELNHEIDFLVLEKQIKEIRKDIKKEFKELIDYIYILLLKQNGKNSERYKILRQSINEFSPDYLIEEFIDSYSDYFDNQIEKNKNIENLFKTLLNDLSENYTIRNQIIKSSIVNTIVDFFFKQKKYDKIVHISKTLNKDEIDKIGFWFELAYSYGELDDLNNAENAYNCELKKNPKSSAAHNNLSLIYEKKGNIEEALKLIGEAKKLEPDKELYERNFNRIKLTYNEQYQKTFEFKEAIQNLENETDFAITKLNYFIQNIKSDKNCKNGKLPIANWMFPKLIGATKELANSLKEQWLNKRYIVKTNDRNNDNVYIYELNPLIEKSIEKINVCKIDEKWTMGISSITREILEDIDYFENILKINKVNKKYKDNILRDYKELTLNYLIKNEKATVILAGSLTEYLLTYYCEKKKIVSITYPATSGKQINRKLYDCVLDDLIRYFEHNNILKTEFFHLNNLARIYRNYVHPGKELRDADLLNMNKAKICYIGVSELMKNIL